MRFGFGLRQAALLMAALGLALGGCGTLSGGGVTSQSLLAATSGSVDTTDPANPVSTALSRIARRRARWSSRTRASR